MLSEAKHLYDCLRDPSWREAPLRVTICKMICLILNKNKINQRDGHETIYCHCGKYRSWKIHAC
jgi:hypothetical protein